MGTQIVVAAVSAIIGGTVVLVTELIRDGIKARRDDALAAKAVASDHLHRLEGTVQDLRDEVAGLAGLVVGAGIVPDRRGYRSPLEKP